MGSDSGNSAFKVHEIMVGKTRFSSNVLMAPLAGYTCFPFRVMVKTLGAGSTYTEMVSADALKYNDRATFNLLFTDARENLKCVQLLGSIPTVFEKAARSDLLAQFDVIDINMGCPVPNVIKSGEGCALMEDIPRASKIIEACKRSGKTVSVKCRLGMNRRRIVIEEFARMCEASGADMITIHGRTRDMMYDGTPLYEYIRLAKESVDIPVFANGGIFSKEDAVNAFEKTGADGIMLGRYGFENPLIFAELTGTKTGETKYSLLIRQLELASECFDELYVLTYIKKLASYFMKKMPGTKQLKADLYRCGSISELKCVLSRIFMRSEV